MADSLIRRPEILRSNDLRDHLRWQKHTTDNIDLLARTRPFISLARTLSSFATTSSGYPFMEFDTVEYSQGTAPTWSAADPTAAYIAEDGLYMLNYNFVWDTVAAGVDRSGAIVVNEYLGPFRNIAGVFGLIANTETAAPGYVILTASTVAPLYVGDKVQLRVNQASGGALSVLIPGIQMQIAKIG